MKSESASNGLCGLRASPSAGHVTEVVATNSLLQERDFKKVLSVQFH